MLPGDARRCSRRTCAPRGRRPSRLRSRGTARCAAREGSGSSGGRAWALRRNPSTRVCFAAAMIGRMAAGPAPLLSVRNLTVTFPPAGGEEARVVDGVSFDVAPGEIVALVGESGCGKSLTGLSLIDLVPEPGRVASGDILFEGFEVRTLPEREKEKLRGGGIGFVFQEPGS